MRWMTKRELNELDRQQREGDRIIAQSDWVKIARDAELRRMGLLPKESSNG